MYKKIRNHLTALCTISTAAILFLMVFICLFFVEKQIKVRAEAEFSRDMNAVLYYIRSQRVVDHTWFSQMEKENRLLLYIENEHTPLFYTQLKDSGERKILFDKIRKKALAEQFDIAERPDKYYQASKVIFSIKGENREQYFGGAAVVPLEKGYFGILIAKDRREEKRQITWIRLIFLFSLLFSVFLLFIFSAFFTGRVLRPIERNRKKQIEFIHAASHELRSPLAVIKTSLSIIPETEEGEKIHFCQMAKDECDRMSCLIEQMLFLASHDSGSYRMQFSDVEAETLILTSFERFKGIASAKEINLFVIPNEEPLRKITADKEKLLQVLAILLDNALHYTPKGGSIWLSAKEENEKIKIMVSDNGPGIPKEYQSAVFERFFRGEKSHSDKQHFGLGLSIAKEIISRHKGKITVQERVGGGAFFSITLN